MAAALQRGLEVRVGWAQPQCGVLVMNFHFYSSAFSWRECVPVASLLDLQELCASEHYAPLDALFPEALLVESDKLLGLLVGVEAALWSATSSDALVSVAQRMEQWLDRILSTTDAVPSSIVELVKQLFFCSEQRIAVFEQLVPRARPRRRSTRC